MKVRALVSFSGHIHGQVHPWPAGKVGEMPPGVDWLRIGWVVPVDAPDGELEAEPLEILADEPVKHARKRGKKA